MSIEEGNRIIREEYADLLISTSKTDSILQRYPDASIHPINFLLSLVNIPVENFTNHTVLELGYGVVPAILGLVSQTSQEVSGLQRMKSNPAFPISGQGVLIGIVDTGIDYTNPIFRYPDGTTRIASIWDQTIHSGNSPDGFHYGTEYTREQINMALLSDNPYETVPSKDDNGHGTMVAGIAGGRDVPESNFYSAAPDAEFVIVKLKQAKKYLKEFFCIPEAAIGYQENDVAFGLNYVQQKSLQLQKPVTICLAVNTSEGSHDGRGTFNDSLNLLATTPGVAVVIAVGNEGLSGRHYFGAPDLTSGFDTVQLNVGENEGNFTMALYGTLASILSVDIISPSGETITTQTPNQDEFQEIHLSSENTIIYVDYQMAEPQSGVQMIFTRFINPTSGIWSFIVYQKGDIQTSFNIWLPMTGFITDNTYFIHPDPYTTILSVATTTTTIKVTAYNEADDNLYRNAGRGYSRINDITPDFAAPGVNVIGPTNLHTFASYTGTSASAAYMTGVAAVLMEWGIVRGNFPNMNSVEIKNLIIRYARRNLNIVYPNRDWGYGILDVYNVFENLMLEGIT